MALFREVRHVDGALWSKMLNDAQVPLARIADRRLTAAKLLRGDCCSQEAAHRWPMPLPKDTEKELSGCRLGSIADDDAIAA